MAEFCTKCGKKLSEQASKEGVELCLKCNRERYLSGARQGVSPQEECPLSKIVVEVKTSKGEAVAQAQVTVLKDGVQVKQDTTGDSGKYDTGKVLEAGS
ncbi:MAG: hypothetical protein ACETWB_09105, partial [Anaerolineae bacterium]